MTSAEIAVVLFDGECALCNASVRWLLRHERRTRYRFAPLQSGLARSILAGHDVAPDDLTSVLVLDSGKLYRKSAAVLHLARELRLPWTGLLMFRLVPPALRDALYDYVGARRYHWWGRSNYCAAARPEWQSRFLSSEQ